MHELEKKIVKMFNGRHSGIVSDFSRLISDVYFLFAFWIAITGFILFDDFMAGIFLGLGLAIVYLLNLIISGVILKKGAELFSLVRPRPFRAYPEEIHPIGKNTTDSSFPSIHTAAMTGGLLLLVYFYPNMWFAAVCVLLLLSWSRIRNGMHYPSDILAGIVLGLGYGFLALWILKIMLS